MQDVKIPPKRKLTKKRKGFAKDYARDENGTRAVLNNFDIQGKDPEKIASVMAVELLGKPSVVEEIEKQRETLLSALENEGVTPKYLARNIKSLIDNKEYQAKDKGISHATKIYGVEDLSDSKRGSTTYIQIFAPNIQAKVKEIDNAIKEALLNETPQ